MQVLAIMLIRKKHGYINSLLITQATVTPSDWYNARLRVDFKVNQLADGDNVATEDHNGIVNSSHSFIKKHRM